MEKGLYLTDYNMLQNNLTEFNYIYYGNEFCMSRYICLDGLCKVIEYCKKHKKTVCLLTPYIPDHYMEYMVNLLDQLLQYDVKIELIINDYGLMYLFAYSDLSGRQFRRHPDSDSENIRTVVGHLYSTIIKENFQEYECI